MKKKKSRKRDKLGRFIDDGGTIEIICKNCNKKFFAPVAWNRKFCSNKCKFRYFKKHKKGFWDSKFQSMNGNISAKVNRRNKSGLFDSKIQRMGIEINRKNKTGIFNPKIQSKGGKIQGPITVKLLRERRNIKFNMIYFDSYKECEVGMCIHYQIEKLIERKNYQIKVGTSSFDFLIKGCFIEYHPYNSFYDKKDVNLKNYYQKRRNVLNENGYKDYPLLIIK